VRLAADDFSGAEIEARASPAGGAQAPSDDAGFARGGA
jgi:hypothetical protein